MDRRPGRATLALVAPQGLFLLFGVARIEAPIGVIGFLFDEPFAFVLVAGVIAAVGAALLLLDPVQLAVAGVIAGDFRLPQPDERARLEACLSRVGRRAAIDPQRLIVRVKEDPAPNAGAGAGHLLFVTSGALGLPEDELEAVLAHELGHHRGLHPVSTAVLWWLSLPGIALAGVFSVLRRTAGALARRLGLVGRLLAVPVLAALLVWQVATMWLWWLGDVLAKWAGRVSELEADRSAARWGYALPLAAALERLGAREIEPSGRLARLRAEHPPTAERVERLRALAPSAASAL